MQLKNLIIMLILFLAATVHAEINITSGLQSFEVEHGDKTIVVKRDQNPKAVLTGDFARTTRPCPPFCVQSMEAAPGVKSIGIRELVNFMQTELAVGQGILIDARTPVWHVKGTIPGSINLPYTQLNRKAGAIELEIEGALESLGAKEQGDQGWDFSEAAELVLWCNGNWCGQSTAAIQGLLAEGYPAEKLRYFIGGMEDWLQYGLNIVIPEADE